MPDRLAFSFCGAEFLLISHGFTGNESFLEAPPGYHRPLSHYIRIVVENKLIFITIFLLIFLGSIIFGLTRRPQYRSTASLRIELGTPSGGGIGGLADFQTDFNFFYATQVQSLKEMAEGSTYGLPSTSADGSKQNSPGQPAPWRDLQVDSNRGSRLIDLGVNADDPFVARDRLRQYIREYIETDSRRKADLINGLLSKLKLEVKQAADRMLKSQKELVDFSKEHGKVFVEQDPDFTISYLDSATRKVMESRKERLDLETVSLHRQMILPRNIDNQYIRKLRETSASLKGEYISASSALGPGHFQQALYESKIYALEKAIADLEKSEFSNTLESARRRESAALATLEIAKQEAIKSGSLALQFEVLKKAARADAEVYFALCEKVKDAALFSQLVPHSVYVENPPSLPSTPFSPVWKKIIAAGFLLGLGGGLSAIFIRTFLDNRIRSARELKIKLNLPVLGVVPDVRLVMPGGLETFHNVRHEFIPAQFPVSPFTDAIRVVRESIAAILERDIAVVLSVTSALPSDGKTFICLALASAVASERKRVLVVDADLRNPRVGRAVEAATDQPGLSDVLTGKVKKMDEVIRPSHVPGLYYVPSGGLPENPVAVLRSRAMHEWVKTCSETFDVVIIDCPPVLGFADALIVGSHVDGVLLVVKQGNESLEPVINAREALVRAKTPLLGTVFNMAETGESDLGWFTSKAYSKYYHSRYYDHTDNRPRS